MYCIVRIDTWLTSSDLQTGDPLKLLERQAPRFVKQNVADSGNESNTIRIEIMANDVLQSIVGYGAGLPQSSAFVLVQLKRKNSSLYHSVMDKLFGSADDEARISVIRFPVGSCDFSIQNTSYDEHVNDFDLSWFALDPDSEYIAEVLLDAVSINPALTLIGKQYCIFSFVNCN